jgi:hypothetical protein
MNIKAALRKTVIFLSQSPENDDCTQHDHGESKEAKLEISLFDEKVGTAFVRRYWIILCISKITMCFED